MSNEILWHIEKRKITDLKPYHKNPRELSKKQEAELYYSMDTFGVIDKPFINLDNTIIGGHQRIQILKKMEYKEIEVNVPNRMLTENEVEELNIRHNKNVGDWDWDILANEFDIEELLKWGFEEHEFIGKEEKASMFNSLDDENENLEKCPQCNQKIKGRNK